MFWNATVAAARGWCCAHACYPTGNLHAQLQVLNSGGLKLLLSLPRACLLPNFARVEPCIIAVLCNILEDPITLDVWMESEVRISLRWMHGWNLRCTGALRGRIRGKTKLQG